MQAAQSVINAPRVTLQCVLADLAGQGDQWAQDELLRLYDPLIRSTSMGLLKGCVSQTFEDIKQLGYMATLQLAASFKIESGAVFTTYMFHYLGRKVRKALDDSDRLVRIPSNQVQADRKSLKEKGIAKFNLNQTASIDSATSAGGEEIFGADDLLAFLSGESVNDDNVDSRIDAERAMKAIQRLRPVDRQVVTMRLFRDLSFQEIGDAVGRTRQGAVNSYVRGMGRLRELCGAPPIAEEDVGWVYKKRGLQIRGAKQ